MPRDYKTAVSPEQINEIVAGINKNMQDAEEMYLSWCNERMAVPEVRMVADDTFIQLTTTIRNSMVLKLYGGVEDSNPEEAMKQILAYLFLTGYNRGLKGTPLLKIKGLDEADHSGN